MAKKGKSIQNTVSFGKAQEMLSKFRYKPRREWSKDDRVTFKVCNFAVLSKKRLNKVFSAFDSIAKLSDKSHYKYSELDILILKELILENLNVCFQKFNLDIKIIKEIDIQKIQDHLDILKEENLRLENETKRLQFIIENYVRENKLEEIDDINQILKIKLPSSQIVSKKKKSKNLEFDEENLKKFMQKWRTGHTTVEISEEFKKENLDIERSRKKRFKL
ncbi:MAG: hypothetical protein CMM95_02655 [Rickettsiales bacterium]|nr:hypothetical protein [Rickettsiales bacterium]